MATSAQHALILGNGDVNALLHASGDQLVLRLTKNDVWDARLDTSNDPPIPTVARIKEMTASGAIAGGGRAWILPKGSTWRGPDGYHKYPYPSPRPCAVLRIGGAGKGQAEVWRCIRSQGRHNSWRRGGGATVMRIEGKAQASNGYACNLAPVSTDEYGALRVKLSGSTNAKYFVDVKDDKGLVILSSKWIDSPEKPTERTFALPPGKRAAVLILYTWTVDGKPAENRFESVAFAGKGRTRPVALTAAAVGVSASVRLDLRRAVARVTPTRGGPPRADVRALAGRNVFLISTSAAARLEPFRHATIPTAERSTRDGVSYLAQTLPGDGDWPGMRFAVALAGTGEHKAVAIVTSFEAKDPVAAAGALLRRTLSQRAETLITDHEVSWRTFWSAGGVDLPQPDLRDAWYRNLYFLRCVSKPGVECVGLFAGLVSDGTPAWHGNHTLNYNAQQTFWTSYVANHVELAEPYERLITRYLPRARWLCKRIYDCQGAYIPHVMLSHEPPDPATCRTKNHRQYIHHVWGFTIGVSGFAVQNLWWRYKYAPDREYLRAVAYPAVRDVAVFYANFVDQCDTGAGGKAVLAPSVSPEHWGWHAKLARNRNGAFDIAYARFTLTAAVEGARTLGCDAKLVARFRGALARLPAYPTTGGDKPVVVDVQDAPPITYNITVPATPVFPADVVTWWSPEKQKRLFARTIGSLRWNGNNSSIMMSVARARLSMPGTAEWVRKTLAARYRPNGTFGLNRVGSGINTYGHYTEQFAATMVVSELLIQSVGDIVRLFPAWPKGADAKFASLRTQGGFVVTASRKAGKTAPVTIVSTVGGTLRLLSPWPTIAVRRGPGRIETLKADARGVVEIDTRPAESLVFQPAPS